MRYYNLTLQQPGGQPQTITSHPGGKLDDGAPNIIFDIEECGGGVFGAMPTVIIEGVPLSVLSNANKIATGRTDTSASLNLTAGMKPGMPLANAAQIGPLAKATVQQSWGNWIGTEMNLSMLIQNDPWTSDNPGPINFVWGIGQSLEVALQQCFSTAWQGIPVKFAISPLLVAARFDYQLCRTFDDLAAHVLQLTTGMLNANYPGVWLSLTALGIRASDGTPTKKPKQLAFQDMIGQPVWVGSDTISVQTVLRGDIGVCDYIQFPTGFSSAPGFVTTTQNSQPTYLKYQSTIQGQFFVRYVRHQGDFRSLDGRDWMTTIEAVVPPGGA